MDNDLLPRDEPIPSVAGRLVMRASSWLFLAVLVGVGNAIVGGGRSTSTDSG